MSDIDAFLKICFDQNASELDNANARIQYLESVLCSADVDKDILKDNKKLLDNFDEMSKKLRYLEGRHRADQEIMRQKDDWRDLQTKKLVERDRLIGGLRKQLQNIGAFIAKKY